MQAPNSANTSPLGIQARLALAWLALAWERIWTRFWIVAICLEIVFIVFMIDVLPDLHWSLHALVLIAAAGGLGWLVKQRFQGFAWPRRDDARVRLETSSAVTHRPLTAVEDSLPPGATAEQRALWRLHQARAQADLERLRVTAPAPGIALRDRFAFRAAVVLVLVVAVIGAWGNIGARMERGLWPVPGNERSLVAVKVWVTPPEYTGRSPVYLETPPPAGSKQPSIIDVPAGSKVLAVVTGTNRPTELQFGETTQPLEQLADASQRGGADLKPSARLEVRQGRRTLAGWDMNWIADEPPAISFAGPPGAAPRWRLRIPYKASDDYGIASVKAHISRVDNAAAAPLEVTLTLPADADKSFSHADFQDLSSHPLAGYRVLLRLIAADKGGQTATSPEVQIVMPERVFTHPVAIHLAQLRKKIMIGEENAIERALTSVTNLLQTPVSFGGDSLVHLTLSTAKGRLSYGTEEEAAREVPDLLWNAAVRIEDGNLVDIEKRLAAAENALREALDRNASPEEIAQLLDELKEAAAEYAKKLAENNDGQKNELSKNMKQEDLSKSMDEVQRMSEMGANEAAKKAMANLQKQLEAMRNNNTKNKPPESQSEQAAKAQEALDALKELTKEQSDLLNKSFDEARKQEAEKSKSDARQQQKQSGSDNQQQQQKNDPHGNQQSGGKSSTKGQSEDKSAEGNNAAGQAAAKQQDALREKLEQLQQQMKDLTNEANPKMQGAADAMSSASEALSAGGWQKGADAQGKALSQLEEGMEQASQQLMQSIMQAAGDQMPSELDTDNTQPGSRGRSNSSEFVDVPTGPDNAGAAQRVRAILDEIRKRSSDRTRPESEQDYLRRLQKQF